MFAMRSRPELETRMARDLCQTLQVHGIDPNHRLLTVSRALWNGTPLEQRSGHRKSIRMTS